MPSRLLNSTPEKLCSMLRGEISVVIFPVRLRGQPPVFLGEGDEVDDLTLWGWKRKEGAPITIAVPDPTSRLCWASRASAVRPGDEFRLHLPADSYRLDDHKQTAMIRAAGLRLFPALSEEENGKLMLCNPALPPLRLRVVSSEIRRLQSMTRQEALGAGVRRAGGGVLRWERFSMDGHEHAATPQEAYAIAMKTTAPYGPFSWLSNPWVAFARIEVVHDAAPVT